MIYQAKVQKVLTQVVEFLADSQAEADRMAQEVAHFMPVEDFNSICSVVSLLPVKDIQLTFNWDET